MLYVCMQAGSKKNLDGYKFNALHGSKFGQYGEYCD